MGNAASSDPQFRTVQSANPKNGCHCLSYGTSLLLLQLHHRHLCRITSTITETAPTAQTSLQRHRCNTIAPVASSSSHSRAFSSSAASPLHLSAGRLVHQRQAKYVSRRADRHYTTQPVAAPPSPTPLWHGHDTHGGCHGQLCAQQPSTHSSSGPQGSTSAEVASAAAPLIPAL